MSACYFCNETYDNSASIYACPNCHNKVCYQCLLNSLIHNNNCLCPFCDYELDIFKTTDELPDEKSDLEETSDECILCYETYYHPIKCETCHHSYCKECFKKLIEINKAHPICAYCRQSFSKTFIDKSLQKNGCYQIHKMFEKGCHKFPFDMDDKVIKCKHCHKRFEYGVLKAYFMAKMKYIPDYKPECILCHQEWDNTFMYDNFERNFCKNSLKLLDPEACIYCQERKTLIHCKVCVDCLKQHFQENGNVFFDCKKCHEVFTPEFMYNKFGVYYCKDVLKIKDPEGCYPCNDRYHRTYTCKYCNEILCKEYTMKRLKEKYEKKEEFDCMKCHHKYSDEDLDQIYGKETCKKELHIKYPEDCIICNSEEKHFIDEYNEKIACPFCNKNICISCITHCLRVEADENYHAHNNDPNIRYVREPYGYHMKCFIDDTLHCPHCKHIWSNQYIYEIYKKYVFSYSSECKHLHIAAPSMVCYKCGMMPGWPSLRCEYCDKVLCQSCYTKIIYDEYGLIDTSTLKYSLIKEFKEYEFSPMLKTKLKCKDCSVVLCKIKLVYSRVYHGNGQYDKYQFELTDYTISDTYSDYRA